jgi:hypothetical protein
MATEKPQAGSKSPSTQPVTKPAPQPVKPADPKATASPRLTNNTEGGK